MDELYRAYSAMVSEWHRILGCSGNYYEGSYLAQYLLSVITYKRFCDFCEYQISLVTNTIDSDECDEFIDESCDYCYPPKARWKYVSGADNKVLALNNAINVINEKNFINIPYGTKIIPDYSCHMRNEKWANEVLLAWFQLIDPIQLSPSQISTEDWTGVSRWLRSKCI